MTRFVRVLHLSDFHHDDASLDTELVVVNALLESLRKVADTDERPDLIVFSGDLVDGGDANHFDSFHEHVLAPICEVVGLPSARLMICPGNHDVQREEVQRSAVFLRGLRDAADPLSALAATTASGDLQEYVERAFANYLRYARKIGMAASVDGFQHAFAFPDLELSAVSLNTAFLSMAGLEKDIGKLSVRELDFLNLPGSLQSTQPDIIFQHHPPEFLNETTAAFYSGGRLGQPHALLFGHMHRARPISIFDGATQRTVNQAGALFYKTHRNKEYKGYSLVTLDRERRMYKTSHRKFYVDRTAFDIALDDYEGGITYSSEKGKRHFEVNTPRFCKTELVAWRADALQAHYTELLKGHLAKFNLSTAPVDLEFEIVDPLLEAQADPVDSKQSERVSLQKLMTGLEHVVIHGEAESGKTTALLRWAQLRTCEPDDARVPVLIRWEDSPSLDAFVRLVKRAIPDLPGGFAISDLLQRGLLEIIIDDIVISQRSVGQLNCAIEAFPRCRFVVAYRPVAVAVLGMASIVPEELPFKIVRVCQLRRGHIRELVRQKVNLQRTSEESLIQDILREAVLNNLPLTPFTIASIVDIYSRDGTIRFANKANFVERLLEFKLEKFSSSEIDVNTFDFNNKAHCLTQLAGWMEINEKYVAEENDITEWLGQYVRKHGFAVKVSELLRDFLRAGVLENDGGQIRFGFRIFLEYFIANKMKEDGSFREHVFDEKRYLAYPNEIALYAAMTRKDGDLLELLDQRLAGIEQQLLAKQYFSADAGTALDATPMTSGKATNAQLEAYRKQINSPQLTEAEQDELLDGETPGDVGRRQEVYRPELKDPEAQWLYALLLYSSVVRYSDFLDDENKSKHVSLALQHWLRFAQFGLNIIPRLSQTGSLKVDGVRYRIQGLTKLKLADRYRALQTILPLGVARMASFYMNSDKLRNQLRSAEFDNESGFMGFMRISLLADLGYKGFAADLDAFLKHITKKSRYAAFLTIRKASEAYRLQRVHDDDVSRFRRAVTNTIARMRVGNSKRLPAEQSKALATLEKTRLTIEMHRKSEGKE